jgi:hypothetical protein
MEPPSTQSPFAPSRRYLHGRDVNRLLGGHYPSVIALTDSCADPATSSLLRPKPRSRCLRRLPSAPAASRTFSTLFCESFLGCLVPCHGGPIGCMCLLPSPMSSAFPKEGWVGFPLYSTNATFRGLLFEAADIPLCSGPQVCSPPRSRPPLRMPQGGRDFYVRAERASLPPHAPDTLAV